MSETVITVENLSKRYLVGHRATERERYSTLRDTIVHEAKDFARRALNVVRGQHIVQGDEIEEFWALKNVSFDVKRGEVIGIIGRNGAGKSTLLKILSRITEPSDGRVTLQGRVASLLEVGTGFHPELTGRENIFLNGAILGMSQRDIKTKFDEIVSFAEVERFLDTPVKRYSSGMYVRLAFAVAAHLEPEILIVDEVLAVGDAKFQEKCLGKMKDVATQGRTILFVSHNMSAILGLTQHSILLSEGTVEFIGSSPDAVERYMHGSGQHASQFDVRNSERRFQGTGDVRILSLGFDRVLPYFEFMEPLQFVVHVRAEHPADRIRVSMTIFSGDGSPVGSCFSPEVKGLRPSEECELLVHLAAIPLAPGHYFCGISIGRGNHRAANVDYDVVTDTLYFEVAPEKTSSGSLTAWAHGWGSISFPDLAIERKII